MLEDLTDELAGLSEVLISGVVSLRVIDFLEVVDVAVNKGKFRFFPGEDLLVQFLFHIQIRQPALDAG